MIQEVELTNGRDHPGQKCWILSFSGFDTAEKVFGCCILNSALSQCFYLSDRTWTFEEFYIYFFEMVTMYWSKGHVFAWQFSMTFYFPWWFHFLQKLKTEDFILCCFSFYCLAWRNIFKSAISVSTSCVRLQKWIATSWARICSLQKLLEIIWPKKMKTR